MSNFWANAVRKNEIGQTKVLPDFSLEELCLDLSLGVCNFTFLP